MYLKSWIKAILVVVILGPVGWSCNNDLVVQSSDNKELPVISGVLELQRDTQYIRITRSFTGFASGLTSAKMEDSVYFPEARIWLEKWNGDQIVSKAELVKAKVKPRSSGIFLSTPNWYYILVRSPENEPLFTGTQSYHLTAEIPGLPLVYAQTAAYPHALLHKPKLTFKLNLFMDPLDFEWSTRAPYEEFYFRLLYTDVYQDTAIAHKTDWREYHSTKNTRNGSVSVFGQDLMKRIAVNIRNNPAVIYRYVTHLQIVVVGISGELYDYREMSQTLPTDQIGYPVTNIVNGIGLFCSQTETTFDLEIDQRSKDSIMNGQYTRHLNLRFY